MPPCGHPPPRRCDPHSRTPGLHHEPRLRPCTFRTDESDFRTSEPARRLPPRSRTREPSRGFHRRLPHRRVAPGPAHAVPTPARLPRPEQTHRPQPEPGRPPTAKRTNDFPPARNRHRHPDPASPAALALRSGVRLVAAPVPPSGSLPEGGYHPVTRPATAAGPAARPAIATPAPCPGGARPGSR